jgi:DNA polymerase-3 subunit delta
MLIYYSNSSDLVQFEAKKYRKDGVNYKIIDAEELNEEEILNLMEQTSIFEDDKIKVFTNADFLNKKTNKPFVEKLLKLNDNSIFLLDIGEKGKLQEFLLEKAKKIDALSTKSINDFINNILKENNAAFDDQNSLTYFIETVNNNPFSIETELNKLINFDKKITKENITALIRSNSEENIFNLLNYILLKNYNSALNILDNLILNKFTIIEIINYISPSLISLKIVNMALAKKMSSYQIQNELFIPF